MTVIKNLLDKYRSIINLKKEKTESMLFRITKRLFCHGDLKVSLGAVAHGHGHIHPRFPKGQFSNSHKSVGGGGDKVF